MCISEMQAMPMAACLLQVLSKFPEEEVPWSYRLGVVVWA